MLDRSPETQKFVEVRVQEVIAEVVSIPIIKQIEAELSDLRKENKNLKESNIEQK